LAVGDTHLVNAFPERSFDLDLVARALAGDRSAEAVFVDRMRCIPAILGSLNRRRGRPLSDDDLLELSQDVFERLWTKLGDYRGEAALETWAYQFCVHTFANRARLKIRRGGHEKSSTDGVEPTAPPAEALAASDSILVRAALDVLPHEEQQVIRLRIYDDLGFDVIGTRLGISPNTAKTRYYRGLNRLETSLAPKLGEGG
jgi:RNA polymerase sigma-70 factor, ECF subfamily